MMTTKNLLVELFVEELPPKALKKLGDAFASQLADQLRAIGLINGDSVTTAFASPRRLAAHISHVWLKAADKAVQQKLMPVAVGLDTNGNATPALIKKLQALGADVSNPAAAVAALKRAPDGKADALFYDSLVTGATLDIGLQKALEEAVSRLPIPKVMSYQLERDCALPGWSSVNFVRPAHGLVALHGKTVVPVKVLGLTAGHTTQGHRFEAALSPLMILDADSYADTLRADGAVIASFAERKAEIARQLAAAASKVGGGCKPIEDDALLDEVTALVERPNVLVCQFEKEFLDVPQECLILTMKANQKYFPLLDAAHKLTNKFLVVSNITPSDASLVIGEIRDLETAQIAVQASLTGHLVFSTLHTNDASGAVTRLIDMNVEPYLIASTLEAVLGQRLVRTICPNCKEPFTPDNDTIARLSLKRENVGDRQFYYGKGCTKCSGTGYKGRKGVFEYLRISDPIRDLINERLPTLFIRERARELGMRTMREDAIRNVLDGYTTVDEILRYT